MAQQILSTNTFTTAKWIVSATASDGTHTTIGAALTSASSGDTIFIRPGTYTENLTLKAGINLAAFTGDADTPTVTIIGKATFTGAGTVCLSNLKLQTNSDFFLAVTGSSASIVNMRNCYLNASNNTGITYTSSSSSSAIQFIDCRGDIGTTGIGMWSMTSTGSINVYRSVITNSGASATASSNSAGSVNFFHSIIQLPLSTTSTGGFGFFWSSVDTSATTARPINIGGSGTSSIWYSQVFGPATPSAITIGVGATLNVVEIKVTTANSPAIDGAGAIVYGLIHFTSNTSITTTTQTPESIQYGILKSTTQPAFLASSALQSNVTGDNTVYTQQFTTEVYDQNNNFDATSTFTAPVTGRYSFFCSPQYSGLTASHTAGNLLFVASNRTIAGCLVNFGAIRTNANIVQLSEYIEVDMDAADTLTTTIGVFNGTKVVSLVSGCFFGGHLIC